MKIPLTYYYKGSSNCYIRLEETHNYISVYSDYNELITFIYNGNELKNVIESLVSEKFT